MLNKKTKYKNLHESKKKLDFLENKVSKVLGINLCVSFVSMITTLLISGYIGLVFPILSMVYFGLTFLSVPFYKINVDITKRNIVELEHKAALINQIESNKACKQIVEKQINTEKETNKVLTPQEIGIDDTLTL